MFFQTSPVALNADDSRDSAELLNGVGLSGPQFAAALEVLALLPEEQRHDPRSQAMALQAYAMDVGFADEAVAGAALHARITALAKWTLAHDPERQSDPQAVIEAAARHPLVDGAGGIGFEGTAFQEMILFIEELPW